MLIKFRKEYNKERLSGNDNVINYIYVDYDRIKKEDLKVEERYSAKDNYEKASVVLKLGIWVFNIEDRLYASAKDRAINILEDIIKKGEGNLEAIYNLNL